MKLLTAIESPADLRKLPLDVLPVVAAEMREFLVETVSRTGGTSATLKVKSCS